MITKCPRGLTIVALAASLLLAGVAPQTRAQEVMPQDPMVPDNEAPSLPSEAKEVNAVAIVNTDAALAKINNLKSQLADITERFGAKGLSDDALAKLEAEALEISVKAKDISLEFQPRVQRIELRLAELKPVGENAVQSESAKLEEESQRKILDQLGEVTREAQFVASQSADLSISITQRRRGQFSEQLFQREKSTLDPDFWSDVKVTLPRLLWRVQLWAANWEKSATQQVDGTLAIIFAIGLLATIVLIIKSRSYILKRIARDPHEEPRQSKRVISALFVMLVNLSSAAVASVLLYVFLDGTGSMPEPFDRLVFAFLIGFTLFAVIVGLSRALFAPGRENWRLVPISAAASGRAASFAAMGGILTGLAVGTEGISQILDIPLPVTIAVRAFFTTLIAILCLLGLRALSHREAGDTEDTESRSNLWRLVLPFAWFASFAALAAPVFGYVALGWFLVTQLVMTAVVCGVVWLCLATIEEFTTSGFQAGQPPAKFLTGLLGFTPQGAEQIGVLVGGAAKLTLLVIAVLGVLLTWGLSSTEINRLEGMVTQFRVGDVTISITTIFSAIAIFIIGFMITRAVQRWLENRYLPKTQLDVGLKTSIRTAVGYVGFVIAAMFAFSHLGVQLANLALVAGALSVGIGFGLQSIVSNFVSGLILLAERPIRTGDWVVVDGQHGTVRKINVRSTEIETFDRATMIVPNSNLISGVVTNWVLNDNTGRIIIPVGVDYDSDPEQVREVLLDCVRDHPFVLAYPEPKVFFMDFGASSLNFELRCYLSDIGMGLSVRSDLRFEIARRFKEAGIEMPFPQRVVQFRNQGDPQKFEDAVAGSEHAVERKPVVPRDA